MANETNTDKPGPTVAVVIPTYKRKSKLERAVNSVYNQTYTDWQLYVVNDAPTQDVSDLLPDDDRITYIQHDENRGAPAARNTGIQSSESEFIALLDDDDAWKVEKLERQINTFEDFPRDYGLIYTGRDIVIDDEVVKVYNPDITGEAFDELLYNNIIPSETPLINRECFRNVGYFDTALPSEQDIDMWLRIAREYKIGVIPDSLAIAYKGHEDRISKNIVRKVNGKKKFIDKHDSDLELHPEAMATHLKQLGIYTLYLNQSRKARKYFIESLLYNKSQIMPYFYILITISPTYIQNILVESHRSITS